MARLLPQIVPDVNVLLELSTDDLAEAVLCAARDARQQRGLVHIQSVLSQMRGDSSTGRPGYQTRIAEAERAVNSAWHWLVRYGLLVPDAGGNGWHYLSVEAERLGSAADFESFRHASAFPRHLLHTRIVDVYRELMRGEYDTAVFKAMRAVEEAVRDAGHYTANDLGKDLMRAAFNPDPDKGPLTSREEIASEREALAHLFAGAIGYFKNPQSHRTVNVDPAAARELVIFASLLLRIVDERRAAAAT